MPRSKGPLGVFVRGSAGATSNPRYTVSLVGADGKLNGQADAANRRTECRAITPLTKVSTSNSRAYFLDGDFVVMSLEPGGLPHRVMDLAGSPDQEVVFAVSADDRRIAVALLDNLQYPVTTHLYVADVGTAANRVDIFSGPVLEWPVGWHQGNLIVAVGSNSHPQNCIDVFSQAELGYHVVNASTGDRLRTICADGNSTQPALPVPAGVICSTGASMANEQSAVLSWAADSRSLRRVGQCSQTGVLSRDGEWIASTLIGRPDGCANQNEVYLLGKNGVVRPTNGVGMPEGWIDVNHLVLDAPPGNAGAQRFILDTSANLVVQLPPVGFFAGSLPGGLD